MSSFGLLLRRYRLRCKHPERPERPLSQERLGELLEEEMGIGFSGAAVSDWERGESTIHADQRPVLIGLIAILHRLGGLPTSLDANELLYAGNYRGLNPDEKQKIFSDELDAPSPQMETNTTPRQQSSNLSWRESLPWINDELHKLIVEAQEGPAPAWPRVIATVLRKFSDRLSKSNTVVAVFWLWLWLLTWILIAPSLRFPFTSREDAEVALKIYIGATIVGPMSIGLLTNTKENTFWQQHNLASNYVTRLYTYQGAGIGFHLGYFGVFAINLLGYYLHLHFALWFELVETGIILLWGYFAARLVPYNLWQAYKRLDLADGRIFFIFFLLGPFWAYFFFNFYPIFFTSIIGASNILLAITLLILIPAWQQYRKTKTQEVNEYRN